MGEMQVYVNLPVLGAPPWVQWRFEFCNMWLVQCHDEAFTYIFKCRAFTVEILSES